METGHVDCIHPLATAHNFAKVSSHISVFYLSLVVPVPRLKIGVVRHDNICISNYVYAMFPNASMSLYSMHICGKAYRSARYCTMSCSQAPLSPSNWSALYRRSRLASHELNIPQGQQRTAGSRGGR